MVSDSEEPVVEKKKLGHRRNLSNGVTTLRVSDNEAEVAKKVFLPNTPLPMQENSIPGVPASFPDWEPKYKGCCGGCHLKNCVILVSSVELCEMTARLLVWLQLDTFMGAWSHPITAVALTILFFLILWSIAALVCLIVARNRANRRLVVVELTKQVATLVYVAVIMIICIIYASEIKQHVANRLDHMFMSKTKWLEVAEDTSSVRTTILSKLPSKQEGYEYGDEDEYKQSYYDEEEKDDGETGDFFQEAAKWLATGISSSYFFSLILTAALQSWLMYWIIRYYWYHHEKELYYIRQFCRAQELSSIGRRSTADDDPPPSFYAHSVSAPAATGDGVVNEDETTKLNG